MRTMYDSVDASAIPADAELVAGYVNGPYAWSQDAWSRFPHARAVPIATRADYDGGIVLDVENGDATPQQVAGWLKLRRRHGVDPSVYVQESQWEAVRQACWSARVAEPHYWVAHWDAGTDIPAGAVALQHTNTPGYDVSSVADYWPGVDPLPEPPAASPAAQINTEETETMSAGPFPAGARHTFPVEAGSSSDLYSFMWLRLTTAWGIIRHVRVWFGDDQGEAKGDSGFFDLDAHPLNNTKLIDVPDGATQCNVEWDPTTSDPDVQVGYALIARPKG